MTHLSVTLRQRLKFIFRACLKQVTHLLHLLSRDQHWTFLMLMSGIIKCAWVSACVCVSFACNTQGGPQGNGTGTFTKLLWCHLKRRAVLHKWLSRGFTVDLIGFPFRTRENATPLSPNRDNKTFYNCGILKWYLKKNTVNTVKTLLLFVMFDNKNEDIQQFPAMSRFTFYVMTSMMNLPVSEIDR